MAEGKCLRRLDRSTARIWRTDTDFLFKISWRVFTGTSRYEGGVMGCMHFVLTFRAHLMKDDTDLGCDEAR